MRDKRGKTMKTDNKLTLLRKQFEMNRREFSEYLGIPIRTLEDWEAGRRKMPEYLFRLMVYYIRYDHINANAYSKMSVHHNLTRSVNIIQDIDGHNIVIINDIRFKGRKNIQWDEVETYLKEYVGNCYEIEESSEKIFIGTDFPDEYANSRDTKTLKGGNIKAKANAIQGIPEMIKIAINKSFSENKEPKHSQNAKYGWYRYDTRFAIPVYNENEIERYNVFKARMLVRHDTNGELYLYDFLNIKKEHADRLSSDCTV